MLLFTGTTNVDHESVLWLWIKRTANWNMDGSGTHVLFGGCGHLATSYTVNYLLTTVKCVTKSTGFQDRIQLCGLAWSGKAGLPEEVTLKSE